MWSRNCLPFRSTLIPPPVFSGVRVARSLVLNVCFVDRCFPFVLFLLVIVLFVLLRYTDSDYPFWYLQTLLIVEMGLF